MKALIRMSFLILLLAFSFDPSFGQAIGDYRSAGTGAWNSLATWQRFNGTAWVTPTAGQGWPGQFAGSGAVTIQVGHNVTESGSLITQTMGTVVINGTLTISSNQTFSLNTLLLIVTAGLTPPATIVFDSKAKLALPNNAVLHVSAYGLTTSGSCSNNNEIIIGPVTYSFCVGGGQDHITFEDLMDSGGTIMATATAPSPICKGTGTVLTGGVTGAGAWIPAFRWSCAAPVGSGYTFLSTVQSPSTGILTFAGTYTFALTVSIVVNGVTLTNTATVAVIVQDLPTILLSAPGTDDQIKCINTAITNITYNTTGATGATFSGLPAGVNGIWAANVVTISGTPTASGTFNYIVTLTGGCSSPTASGKITVSPDNTITLTSAAGTNAQSPCLNTPIINITYSTNGAAGAAFSGLPAGVNGILAANVVTISGTPTALGLFTYTVTLTGGCGTVFTTGTINVILYNSVLLTSASGTDSQELCMNSLLTNITYSTLGATGADFSGLPLGVTGNWLSNEITISGTPSESGNFSYTIVLTGGCGTISTTGTITVNPLPTTSAIYHQ